MENNHMTVWELIKELSQLDPNMKVVVPDAPYGQPRFVDRIGIVILEEDDLDTNVPAGEYVGIGIGSDLDDETVFEEAEELEDSSEPINEEKMITFDYLEDPVEAETFEEFQEKLLDRHKTSINSINL
jgi:hypothetical protein